MQGTRHVRAGCGSPPAGQVKERSTRGYITGAILLLLVTQGFAAGILLEHVVIRETPTCATEITRDRA